MDYQPISCDQHEQLELAVLRRTRLMLHLKDGHMLSGHALDVYTHAGAEWLKFNLAGIDEVVRLDQIKLIETLNHA